MAKEEELSKIKQIDKSNKTLNEKIAERLEYFNKLADDERKKRKSNQ